MKSTIIMYLGMGWVAFVIGVLTLLCMNIC